MSKIEHVGAASIGGTDNLRGLANHEFLQAVYKTLLADSNFYEIWRVRIGAHIRGCCWSGISGQRQIYE